MDERWEEIERELGRLRPAGVPAELKERLREAPGAERLTVGDRILAAFAGCGAVAACLVVGLVVWQLSQPAPPGPSAGDLAAQQRLAVEYQRLLAAR
jgi:hypothetical protein